MHETGEISRFREVGNYSSYLQMRIGKEGLEWEE